MTTLPFFHFSFFLQSLPLFYTAPNSPNSLLHCPSPAKAGDTLYGLFLLSFSPTLAELAALAGYDYVVVDMEHGSGGIPEALACLRALDAARTPAVLRLPVACPVWAKKALDLGPAGLMLPAVESPAVSHCRYPPRGVCGAAHPIVRASAYGLDDSYLSRCEDDTLIICQVETAASIAEVDAIAVVDGVDVVQMGSLDLSASMGYLWDPGNRKVRATLREAERKVLEAWKKKAALDGNVAYLGGFAMPNYPPEQLKLRGDYVHRVGRTARAGLSGYAVSLVNQFEAQWFVLIEQLLGKKIKQREVDAAEIMILREHISDSKRIALTRMKENGNHKKRRKTEDDEEEVEDQDPVPRKSKSFKKSRRR